MSIKKKITGFIVIMLILLLIMQIASMVAKKSQIKDKNTVALAPGVKFMPKPEMKKQNKEKEIQKPPEKHPEKILPLKKSQEKQTSVEKAKDTIVEEVHKVPQEISAAKENNPQTTEQSKVKHTASEKDIITHDHKQSKKMEIQSSNSFQKFESHSKVSKEHQKASQNNNKTKVTENPPTSTMPKTPETIALSEESFVDLDLYRDKIIEDARYFDKEVEGKYGWGVLGDYEDPDYAHILLGGVPFAIDAKEKRYFRIYISESKVQPAMGISAYGTTGVDANDPILPYIVKNAVKNGSIVTNLDHLSYYYLFSLDIERYIISKVMSAFEWYIIQFQMNNQKALDFRQKARLRIAVWKATRPGGGVLGAAIPVYFIYKGQKIFLPKKYYQQDNEAKALGIVINQSDY